MNRLILLEIVFEMDEPNQNPACFSFSSRMNPVRDLIGVEKLVMKCKWRAFRYATLSSLTQV
jgi:hypothetical protein